MSYRMTTLYKYKELMARRLGFEPRVPFDTPVFKTGAINRTLPSPHIKKVLIKDKLIKILKG